MLLSTPLVAESGRQEDEVPAEFGVEGAPEQITDPAESPRAEAPDESELLFDDPEAGEQGDAELGGNVAVFGAWDFIRMVLVLALVIAAVYGVFFLLRRAAGARFRESELIKLLGSQPLPGNRALHLVQVGSQVFLVGSGDSGVSLISEITDQETIDELRLSGNNAAEPPPPRGFAELITGAVRSGDRGANGGESTNPIQFMGRQRERLRRLR